MFQVSYELQVRGTIWFMATLVERFEGMLFADGYDEAFIGLGWRFHDGPVAV